MGLGDLFKSKENEELRLKVEGSKFQIADLRAKLANAERNNSELATKLANAEAAMTPEMQDSVALTLKISSQKSEIAALETEHSDLIRKYEADLQRYHALISDANEKMQALNEQLIITKDEILVQSFGLYEPKYDFANSTAYKEELSKVRAAQKECIKSGSATTQNTGWTVNGDSRKGDKMIRDMQKLLLRAFNTECDDVISKVRFNNIEASEKRIRTACSTISKLGDICSISIKDRYLSLKIKELYLAHEYQIEKQKEKDQLKQLRAEERERAKLEKEIQEARKKIEKEQKHYTNALLKINQQIMSADPAELVALEEKKAELEKTLGELGKSMEQIDYRAANQKAGYVYIISNIGAFGEGVYKIGMTRRLEPMDRVDELGDASVPFDFDVHALIFSDNAPALEAALHHAFEDRKLNMVNTRREFFRVSLDEIKEVVQKNYDKTVEFYDVPLAEQFRQSELMRSTK